MPQQQPVQQIVDKIIEELDFSSLAPEAQEVFKKNLEAQVLRRLGLIIMQNLDDKGLAAYEKLLADNKTPSTTEMQSFLEEYMPDYEERVKAGMDEFMKEVAGIIQRTKG